MGVGSFAANSLILLFEGLIKGFYYVIVKIFPSLVIYIGLPLFLGGCVISGGFALAILILLTAGSGFYMKFVQKTAITPPLNISTGKLTQMIK